MRLDASERDFDPAVEAWTPGGDVIQGLRQGAPDQGPPPQDVFIPGTHQITPVADEGQWQPEIDMQDPSRRHPIADPQPSPDDIRARYFKNKPLDAQAQQTPAAARAPAERDPPSPQPEAQGDLRKAMALLFYGPEGGAQVDKEREGAARLKLDQQRQAQQMQEGSQRLQSGAFSLDEQKKRAATMQAAADPASPVSQKMREEMRMSFNVIGDAMPNLKAHLEAMNSKLDGMSATDMLSMQDRMGSTIDMARKVAHDRATEAMAQRKLEDSAANTAAINADRDASRSIKVQELSDKRQEREEAKDEKAIDAYGKDVAPIDVQEKLLGDVKNSTVRTGAIPAKLQKLRQFFGLKDDAWDTTEGKLATAKNEIRHAIFGGALTPTEGAEFEKELPGMETPRATFDAKLATTLEKLALKKQAAGVRHPRAVKAQAKSAAAPQDEAAKARAWLQKNPDHPMAQAVRDKLKGL